MKHKWKKGIALTLVVNMAALSLLGCGGASPAKTDAKPIAEADSTNTANAENNDTDDTVGAENSNTDDTTDVKADSANAADAQGMSSGKWHVLDSETAAAVDADFEGSIYKIDADSFYIAPAKTEIMEDGTLLAVGAATDMEIPDEELVQVVFDDDTLFIQRDIYDGGASSMDETASFQELEKDLSVDLKGSFQGDVFHATEIRIIIVH